MTLAADFLAALPSEVRSELRLAGCSAGLYVRLGFGSTGFLRVDLVRAPPGEGAPAGPLADLVAGDVLPGHRPDERTMKWVAVELLELGLPTYRRPIGGGLEAVILLPGEELDR